MKTRQLPFAALVATTSLLAQGTVVPSASATKDPNSFDYYCTFGSSSTTAKNEGHGQYLYDSADVGGAAAWKSIAWRRPHSITSANQATTFSMQIIMSNSPVAYNSPSTTFSLNHGSKASGTPPVMVLNGKISLPANSKGSTWPEPWFAAMPITTFVHAPVKGGSLVIDCLGYNNSLSWNYYCEGHQINNGGRSTTLTSCSSHSDGGRNNIIKLAVPFAGRNWFIQYLGMPSNEPNMAKALNIIGLKGPGQTYLNRTLPIPISQLGFLDICRNNSGMLANDFVLALPMTYTPSTAGPSRGVLTSPTVYIPNDPKLGNLVFYSQPFCPDKKVNSFDQVYMGWANKWTVGTGSGPMGSVVYSTGNNASTTGTAASGYGRTMLLQ